MNKSEIAAEARAWWFSLQPKPIGPGLGDLGALARMRRSQSPTDAYMSDPAVGRLHHRLGGNFYAAERVAVMAAILAMAREDDAGTSIAYRLGSGEPPCPNGRPLSTFRFRRLMDIDDAAGMLTGFRQIVRYLNGRVNIADLALSAYDWNDRFSGDKRRMQWTYNFGMGQLVQSRP